MDSGFGLRTLASAMGAYNWMSDHNGSVWPHDTAITVAGLLRYRHLPGAVRLAERLANGLPDAVGAFDGRLRGLFCGTSPIAFLPAGALSDGMLAASVGKRRTAVAGAIVSGVTPHVPQRTLTVVANLPRRRGKLALTDRRLGPTTVQI
jgi:hypothetical protein